jgi:D-xylonolactonase
MGTHTQLGRNMSAERVVEYECVIGEGPLWHPDEDVLYWVDIPNGNLYRYDPAADKSVCAYTSEVPIGGYTIQDDGGMLLFTGNGNIEHWHYKQDIVDTKTIDRDDNQQSRFNDVIADPRGRVFAGTMPTRERLGKLYRVDRDGTISCVDQGLDIPNGMGFSLDRSTMYLAVSDDRVIYAYDYNQATGELSDRRVFVDTMDENGVPDGLTVDSAGYVWCALWNDSCIVRYTPAGVEERRIPVPPPKASSVTFGGPNYGDVYITTAIGEGIAADNHSEAGSLYRVAAPVRGVPEYRSRIDT